MKNKLATVALLVGALSLSPFASAYANEHHPRGGHPSRHNRDNSGLVLGLFTAGIVGTTIALASNPASPMIVQTPPPPPLTPVYVTPTPVYYYAPTYWHGPSLRHTAHRGAVYTYAPSYYYVYR